MARLATESDRIVRTNFTDILFGFINNAAPINNTDVNEYIKEGVSSVEECIESMKYINEYAPRLNNVLIPRCRMDTEILKSVDHVLKTYLQRLPKNCSEWVSQWIQYIESFNMISSNKGECVICTSTGCELVQFKCNCKQSNMCLSCVLNTWYNTTEGLMKSSITCPLCKMNMSFTDILNSIKRTWNIRV